MKTYHPHLAATVAIALLTGSCATAGSDDPIAAAPSEETTMPASEADGTPDDAASPRATPPGLELATPTPPAARPEAGDGPPVGTGTALFAGQIDPGLDPFVRVAALDLADRLGVSPDAIETVSATLVTWPDTSIGCPRPGMAYAQVLQDGSLIELEHEGRIYRYHTGGDRTSPFLCDPPSDTRPTPAG